MRIPKVYKYKLCPNATQKGVFRRWLGTCRFVYNLCLEHRICHWQSTGQGLSEYSQNRDLTLVKKEPGFEWLNEPHSQVLQDVVRRVSLSFEHFFRGAGFPKWASKHSWHSFRFPQAHNNSIRIEGSRLRLPKVGWVKFYYHRQCEGCIKQVTVKKQAGAYFACILVEQCHDPVPASESQAVGIDLGIARLATLSTGEWYANPKLFQRFGPEVKRLQRKLSRQEYQSNGWKKTKRRLSRVHAKAKRCRQDYLHKASTAIVRKYPALVVEQLQLQNMSRSARGTVSRPGKRVRCKSGLNRSLRDVGLGQFLEMLEYKCRWNGRSFKRVYPRYTSQKCANCGHTSPENRPTQAQFRCVNCGQADHADINASKNIRDLGRISGSQYGQGLRALPVSA